jgi:hypothetical protein
MGHCMADCVYKVRVAGLISPDLLQDELAEVTLEAHQFRTVLIGRFTNPGALVDFLRQLRLLGLEIVEVRRLPTHWAELTIAGECGPELAPVLQTFEAAVSELHTLLRARVREEVGFVDLVLLLESRGLKIASIVPVEPEVPGEPGPRVPTPRVAPERSTRATAS